jgi:predicted HNH restriction endonuclease
VVIQKSGSLKSQVNGMGKVYKLSAIPSTSEYVEGLSLIRSRINELQFRLLQEQYHAPNRTVTATQLAELVGIVSGPGSINLQYGKLGRLFCEKTGFKPSQRDVGTYRWWAVWSNGYEERNPYRFFWEMHPEVAEALEILGWVDSSSVVTRYQQIFSELLYERDDRSPPDARRQAQFKIGWENAASQKRTYTNKTLNSILTWNNLGYRFGLSLGKCSDTEIQAAYDFLAQEYQINFLGSKPPNFTHVYPDEVASPEVFREGTVRQVSVNAYERNPKARQKCIDHYGASCSVCRFNFGKFFGELGEGFIHVHHLCRISEVAEERRFKSEAHQRLIYIQRILQKVFCSQVIFEVYY